jgi:hypothetical protein
MADHELLPDPARAKAPKPARPAPEGAEPGATGPAALPSLVGNAAFTSLVRAGGTPAASGGIHGGVQRAATRSQGAGPLDPEVAAEIDAQRGGGSPLPRDVRADMEHHLGHDLEGVRVHTGPAADAVSRSVQAEAFTTGSDVFFSQGRYDPGSATGRSLLAHELTHVVQQSTGQVANESRVSHPGEASEVQAAEVGAAVAAAPVAAAPATAQPGGATVARQESGEDEEMDEAAPVQRQEAAEEEEDEEPPA